jgi:hypothetical protein
MLSQGSGLVIFVLHGNLLRGAPASVCNQYDVPLTILHILQECPCYDKAHQTFHRIGVVCDILDDCHNTSNIVAFLRGIGDDSLFNDLVLFSI